MSQGGFEAMFSDDSPLMTDSTVKLFVRQRTETEEGTGRKLPAVFFDGCAPPFQSWLVGSSPGLGLGF